MALVMMPRPIGRLFGVGNWMVFGTTAISGTPDTPVAGRAVQLLRRRRDTTLVSETISDATGAWSFDGIQGRAAGDGYTVIAYDHTGTHDPVAKADLIPSPMPPDPAEHP
jgi:hypothetical protein